MRRITIVLLAAATLAGCASPDANSARAAYIQSTTALNQCLLANPQSPSACNAQAQVQQNDLSLYNTLSQ